jgi:hypothetical protein
VSSFAPRQVQFCGGAIIECNALAAQRWVSPRKRLVSLFVGRIGHDNGALIEGASFGAEYSVRAVGALRQRACYRRRMGQAFDLILSLAAAAMVALVLGTVAYDYAGMSADVVVTSALGAAGLISAAVAGGALLRRR